MPPSSRSSTAASQRAAVSRRQGPKRNTAKQENENPTALIEATVDIQEVRLASFSPATNILLYGPPGVGKTVLAGGAPNAVFLSTEIEGAVSAKVTGSRARLWPAPSWEHAISGVGKAERELGPEDWLIVDSGTEMQGMYMRWILDSINRRNPQRDLDIPAIKDHQKYQNGFIRWYSRIIAMQANTIFICNSMNAEDAEGEPRVIPLILGKKGEISDIISAKAGVALYYSVSRESREAEAIGPDIIRRVLAQPFPPWFAKDRYNALGSFQDVQHEDYTAMARFIDLIDKAKKEIDNTQEPGRASRPGRPGRPGRRVAAASHR